MEGCKQRVPFLKIANQRARPCQWGPSPSLMSPPKSFACAHAVCSRVFQLVYVAFSRAAHLVLKIMCRCMHFLESYFNQCTTEVPSKFLCSDDVKESLIWVFRAFPLSATKFRGAGPTTRLLNAILPFQPWFQIRSLESVTQESKKHSWHVAPS